MRISDWSSDVCSSDLGQEKKVDRLRSDLLEAEEELRFVKAYENAAVHWHVVDQLIEIMSPAFAMGPAWTLMRSLSAHVSDEEADKATDILSAPKRSRAWLVIVKFAHARRGRCSMLSAGSRAAVLSKKRCERPC